MSENTDLDQRIVQEMIGRFTAPSFMRRAKLVETSWAQLIEKGSRQRRERLEFVCLRLGQLHALMGSWETVRRWLAQEEDVIELQRLHRELQPRLRLPLESTDSQRILRVATRELVGAMESFNERWGVWLAQLDLQPINQIREAYNRFYLLEKECALGSARIARIGYERLLPMARDDVERHLPLLMVPRFHPSPSASEGP